MIMRVHYSGNATKSRQSHSFLAELLGPGVTFVSYSTLGGKEQGSKCRKGRERKQRRFTSCLDGLKEPQWFTDAT